jgi:hypothetical protein
MALPYGDMWQVRTLTKKTSGKVWLLTGHNIWTNIMLTSGACSDKLNSATWQRLGIPCGTQWLARLVYAKIVVSPRFELETSLWTSELVEGQSTIVPCCFLCYNGYNVIYKVCVLMYGWKGVGAKPHPTISFAPVTTVHRGMGVAYPTTSVYD